MFLDGIKSLLQVPHLGFQCSIALAQLQVLRTLRLDLNDDSLTETPHRIAKMYVDEIFGGLDYAQFPKISVIDNKMGVEEMVRIGAAWVYREYVIDRGLYAVEKEARAAKIGLWGTTEAAKTPPWKWVG